MARPNPSSETVPAPPAGWPDALAEAALQGLAGDIVRTIGPHTEADAANLLLQFLPSFGNVVGRGPHFKIGADRHGLNLFVVLVGPTAKARKGSGWSQIYDLLRAADSGWTTNQVQHGLSSGEGLVRSVWDGTPSDPGAADKRIFILEPEFGGTLAVMSRPGNTLSPTVRQAWDGRILQVITRRSPLKATDAHVSIVGHTTQYDLAENLGHADRFNGLSNRFLWTCVRRSKYLPHGGAVPDYQLRELGRRLKSAVNDARQIGQITLSIKASQLWEEEYPALTADVPGLLGAVTSRAEAQVRRLAATYALLDSSEEIKKYHLRAAIAVWDYCFASARFIFGGRATNCLEDRLSALLAESEEGMTRTEISNGLHHHASSADILRALDALREGNVVTSSRETTGGRRAMRWALTSREGD